MGGEERCVELAFYCVFGKMRYVCLSVLLS